MLTSYRSHCEDKNNDVPCGFNFPIHLRTTYYLMSSLILTNADAGLRLVRKNPLIPRTWRALERTHGRLPSGTEDTLYAMAGLGLVDMVGDDTYSANAITQHLAATPSAQHGVLHL